MSLPIQTNPDPKAVWGTIQMCKGLCNSTPKISIVILKRPKLIIPKNTCCDPTTTNSSLIYGAVDLSRVSLTPLSRPLGARRQRGLENPGPSAQFGLGAELYSPPWPSWWTGATAGCEVSMRSVDYTLTFAFSNFPKAHANFSSRPRPAQKPRDCQIQIWQFALRLAHFTVGAMRMFVVFG